MQHNVSAAQCQSPSEPLLWLCGWHTGLGQAKQVLLTGCSAGGMSTYLHADYVRDQLTNPALVKYKVAALSGIGPQIYVQGGNKKTQLILPQSIRTTGHTP